MKKKTMKKLQLNKTTVAHLSQPEQAKIEGGAPATQNIFCPTPGTRCYVCPESNIRYCPIEL
jgi:hypothetical protein